MNTRTITEEETGVNKKSNIDIFLLVSATLFAIICIASAFLYFESRNLSASIEINKSDIINYTNSIEKIRSDKNIIAAELVANNKSEIVRNIKANEAQVYIKELQDIAKKYKMIFS
jgi:hypothetical protein